MATSVRLTTDEGNNTWSKRTIYEKKKNHRDKKTSNRLSLSTGIAILKAKSRPKKNVVIVIQQRENKIVSLR